MIIDDLARVDWGNWVVTARGIVYVARSEAAPRLLLHNPLAERTTVLREAEGVPGREAGLTASADGRLVVFARVERTESDLRHLVRAAPAE